MIGICKASINEPSISICDYRPQIIDVRHLRAFLWRGVHTFVIMLAIVQLLGFEQSMDLIGNSGVWIVADTEP
jgi:hypothetical protein